MMINIKRRKRQAQENIDTIITGVVDAINNESVIVEKQCEIHNDYELDCVINEIEPKLLLLAQSLQPDWAIPIVVQAIGELYYGEYTKYVFVGNFFKRSLAYLWQNSCVPHGDYKNIARLQELICLCYVIEILYSFKRMFIAIPNCYICFKNGHVTIPREFHHEVKKYGELAQGRGRRFRIAEVNSRLMNECAQPFFKGLVKVLNGESPKTIDIFKGTFYETIPGIENSECAKFWKEIFCRYSLYIATTLQLDASETMCNVIVFKEFAVLTTEDYLTQEIVENSFWKEEWFKKRSSECYGNLVVEKPIIRINPQGYFATSPVLIGDSLNWFIESQLLGYSSRSPHLNMPDKIFKKAFSERFENQCINLFRNYGFLSGHILETGVWKTQNKNIDLKIPDENLFGEIDVFAHHPKLPIAVLLECKVLLDVQDSRSYQNIVAKLRDDSECFKLKLRKKADWVKKAFNIHYKEEVELITCLVTDIPLPVLNCNEEDIAIIDFTNLEHRLEEADELINDFLNNLEN